MAQFPCANCIFWCSGKQLIIQVYFLTLLIDAAGGKKSIILCCMGKLLFFCSAASRCSRLRSVLMFLLFYHSKSDSVLINGNAFITCCTFVTGGMCTSAGVFKCHVSSIHMQQSDIHMLFSRIPHYIHSLFTKFILGIFCAIKVWRCHFWPISLTQVLVGCGNSWRHEYESCVRCLV